MRDSSDEGTAHTEQDTDLSAWAAPRHRLPSHTRNTRSLSPAFTVPSHPVVAPTPFELGDSVPGCVCGATARKSQRENRSRLARGAKEQTGFAHLLGPRSLGMAEEAGSARQRRRLRTAMDTSQWRAAHTKMNTTHEHAQTTRARAAGGLEHSGRYHTIVVTTCGFACNVDVHFGRDLSRCAIVMNKSASAHYVPNESVLLCAC